MTLIIGLLVSLVQVYAKEKDKNEKESRAGEWGSWGEKDTQREREMEAKLIERLSQMGKLPSEIEEFLERNERVRSDMKERRTRGEDPNDSDHPMKSSLFKGLSQKGPHTFPERRHDSFQETREQLRRVRERFADSAPGPHPARPNPTPQDP